MMRVLFLLISLGIALSVNCQTYFREGVKWVCSLADVGGESSTATYQILKCADEGEDALGMYLTLGDRLDLALQCYIKAEGEKVYFKPLGSESWYLLYDFGLTPGVRCDVHSGEADAAHVESWKDSIELVSFEKNSEYSGWEQMVVKDYADGITNGVDGVWLKGLGSVSGPLHNTFTIDGTPSWLMEVWDGETLVYKDKTVGSAGVEDIDAVSDLDIRVEGESLAISGKDVCECSIWSADGKLVSRFEFNGGEVRLSLGQPGIYIVSAGDVIRKVMLR